MIEWHTLSFEEKIQETDEGRIREKDGWVWKKVPKEHVGIKAVYMLYEVRREVIESEDSDSVSSDSICSYCRIYVLGCNTFKQATEHTTDCTAFIGRKLYTQTKEN